MKNFRILFMALLLLAVNAVASGHTTLVLEMRDGSTAKILLSKKPKITFVGGDLKIVSEYCSMEFPRQDVRKYLFCDQDSSAITDAILELKAILEGNTLVISEAPENTTVTIYTVGGKLVKLATAIDGNCSISLNELAVGPYVVSFNNTTFKFLKK